MDQKKATRQRAPMTASKYYRPAITAGLITSGSVLVVTGLTLFPAHYGFAGIWKVWNSVGVSQRAINVAHQVGAIGFLTGAALHITNNRRVISRHAQVLADGAKSSPRAGDAPAGPANANAADETAPVAPIGTAPATSAH